MGQTSESQGDATAPTADRNGRVQYEETLSVFLDDVNTAKLVSMAVVVLLVAGGPIAVGLFAGGGSALVAFGLLLGGIAVGVGYISLKLRVHVRVTDDSVEVHREGGPVWSPKTVEIAFERVAHVQYSDPDGSHSHIYVRTGEHDAEYFMVDNSDPKYESGMGDKKPMNVYREGVRIERVNRPPVYVGSERQVELAEAIAQRSPAVECTEPLQFE